MARYLSPEWLAELDAAVASDDRLRDAAAGTAFTVEQIVTGAPTPADPSGVTSADVRFHVVVDHGAMSVREGAAPSPTVTFAQGYDIAVAVARGEISAQGAFMSGHIRVSGDLPRLARDGGAFAGLDDVLRALRERTTY